MAGVAIGFGIKQVVSSGSPGLDRDGLPISPVTSQAVSSRNPAHLVYPGAETLRAIGAGESRYPAEGVTNSAFAGAVLVTQDSPTQVYSWYKDRLTADGWKPYQLAALLSTQLSAQGYHRNTREYFVVAIDDPHQLSSVISQHVPAGATIVEFRYTIAASQ